MPRSYVNYIATIKYNYKVCFKQLYTPPQHALTRMILSFKIIDKANSKFDLNIKEALDINLRKPKLNAQQNHLALTLSL